MFSKERIVIFAMILGVALLFVSLADWEPEEKEVLVGYWQDGRLQPAPDFTLPALRGDSLTLSDYRGQIVILNIWATWCAPCREEMPAFVGIQEQFRSQGVQFIGLSIDAAGFEAIAPFAAEFNVNYPLVLDDGVAADSYEGNTGVPTTYLINRSGQIWRYMPGALDAGSLISALEYMLEVEPARR